MLFIILMPSFFLSFLISTLSRSKPRKNVFATSSMQSGFEFPFRLTGYILSRKYLNLIKNCQPNFVYKTRFFMDYEIINFYCVEIIKIFFGFYFLMFLRLFPQCFLCNYFFTFLVSTFLQNEQL